MKHRQIKVGMLVSYDYEYLKTSLPLVYTGADRIVLAADKDGLTWSGNRIAIPDAFWEWVQQIDNEHKIEIYRDNFYVNGLTSMQNDTRERNMLAVYMGAGGWHVQVDSDEYFADFEDFVRFLHYLDEKKPRVTLVFTQLLSLFKRTENGYLFCNENGGHAATATTTPLYKACRYLDMVAVREQMRRRTRTAQYSKRCIHENFARTEEGLWQKITNWGHNSDFDTEGYFHYWKAINEKNYRWFRNVHPFFTGCCRKLEFAKAADIPSLMAALKTDYPHLLSATKLPLVWRMIHFSPVFAIKVYRKWKVWLKK